MTQEEILNGNRLIAKFLGLMISDANIYPHVADWVYVADDDEELRWQPARFHIDWSWLMPVWEKIGQDSTKAWIVDEMEITRKKCWIKAYVRGGDFAENWDKKLLSLNIVGDIADEMLIDCVWRGVVEFIKWHNKFIQKKVSRKSPHNAGVAMDFVDKTKQ
jgi:hypothetical protein